MLVIYLHGTTQKLLSNKQSETVSTNYYTCIKQKNRTMKQDGERYNPQEEAITDG